MDGKKLSVSKVWALTGPALVAGVAYLDPGNVATNISAGTHYGYGLLWVLIVANVIAWLVQYLAAKLGLATNKSLSRLMGERIKSPIGRLLYWFQAQLIAIATDLAEIIGGAIALNLLFGIPLIVGCLVTAGIATGLLYYQATGKAKKFELVIIGLIALTAIGFLTSMLLAPAGYTQQPVEIDYAGEGMVLLALGVLGATIMPHAIYVHSALSSDRLGVFGKKSLVRVIRIDVTIAMVIAGTVNVALLVLGAKLGSGATQGDAIGAAFQALGASGNLLPALFAMALFASSLASTSVGTYAGDVILDGLLLKRALPIYVRQLITLVPALIILGGSMNPTDILVLSQIFLSFGIPFALFPLVKLTSSSALMKKLTNSNLTKTIGYTIASGLTALNLFSIYTVLFT
ncbi:MAG: divalent metal cation transporter MntH [Actinomycetota bacterium]|jgi:manganese transport protein